MMVQKQLLKKKLTITLKAEDLFDSSKLNDVKRVNFVVQNRKVNNFNRCIIASISYNFNSFKDKYNGSGSAEDEINRFRKVLVSNQPLKCNTQILCDEYLRIY